VSIRRNLHASLAVRWAAVSERPIWLTVIGWLRPIYWATFSPAFRGSSYPYSVGMGDAFLRAFVPAAKAAIGSL
jgi:hypothetical protein